MTALNYRASRKLWVSAAILVFIACVYSAMSLLTPFALDDWVFMAEWENANGDKPLGLSSLFEFWKSIRLYDNGRLANTISPATTMFSPWKEIFPFLTGIAVALMIVVSVYFAFSERGEGNPASATVYTPLNVAAIWGALFFLLPWRNSLFVPDYSLNYIWATAITLGLMYFVLRYERKGWNPARFAGVLVLSLFAGGWHEGFAVPALFGFLIYTAATLWGGEKFSYQWYCIGVVYGGVTLFFYLCPGLLYRTGSQFGAAVPGMSYVKLFFDFLPVILLGCLVIFTAVFPSLRPLLREACRQPVFMIGIGIVVAGTLLSLLFTHQPRSAFWPDLLAIIMIFILSRPMWERLNSSTFGGYLACLALAAVIIPFAYILAWQKKLDDEARQIMAKIERSDNGTVYHDIIPASALPAVTLKMTNHSPWLTDFHFHALREYTRKPFVAVVPEELESPDVWDSPEMLTGESGAERVGNSIILPYERRLATSPMEVELVDGSVKDAVGLVLPFISVKNDTVTYILVYGNSVEEIRGLTLPD